MANRLGAGQYRRAPGAGQGALRAGRRRHQRVNGQIVLNLGPLIAVAKQDLVAHGFSLANNIPNVNPTVPLFQAKNLGKAQSATG